MNEINKQTTVKILFSVKRHLQLRKGLAVA